MFLLMPFMLLVGWMGGDGMMGAGMSGHGMMPGMQGDRTTGVEVRYLPVAGVAGPGIPDSAASLMPTLVVGFDARSETSSWFGLGLQGNVAMQLNPAAGAGNWVTPYGGILPRLGTNLGPVRIDGGVLAGGGFMGRQASGGSSTLLEVKPIWTLEPRLEIGLQGERMSGALVGTYLVTPYMSELGGLSLGLRVSFKGGSSAPTPEEEHRGGHEDHGSSHHCM